MCDHDEVLDDELLHAHIDRDAAREEVEKLRAVLEWYAEQVAECRKLGSIGDPARRALDADGGERARAALK